MEGTRINGSVAPLSPAVNESNRMVRFFDGLIQRTQENSGVSVCVGRSPGGSDLIGKHGSGKVVPR